MTPRARIRTERHEQDSSSFVSIEKDGSHLLTSRTFRERQEITPGGGAFRRLFDEHHECEKGMSRTMSQNRNVPNAPGDDSFSIPVDLMTPKKLQRVSLLATSPWRQIGMILSLSKETGTGCSNRSVYAKRTENFKALGMVQEVGAECEFAYCSENALALTKKVSECFQLQRDEFPLKLPKNCFEIGAGLELS